MSQHSRTNSNSQATGNDVTDESTATSTSNSTQQTATTVVTPNVGTGTSNSSRSGTNSGVPASLRRLGKKHKVPDWQMGIQAFFHEKKNKYKSGDDESTIELVQQKSTTYSPSHHLSSSPRTPNNTNLNITNITMGEEEVGNAIRWDPRGYDNTNRLMPSTYCPSCRCPEEHCHNKVFGPFCELHIIYEIYNADYPVTLPRMEEMYLERYNYALQFKIYEQTGTLDVEPTGYALPHCIRENSLTDCVEYVNFRTYHFRMNRRITVGRHTPFDGAALDDNI
jgi:hypothetical protein